MNEALPDSDFEIGSDMLNSSQSSLSDTSSTVSRLSFEIFEIPAKSPVRSPSKPHKRLDSSYEAIRSLSFRQGGLNFRDFRLVRRLGSGDIGNVYLCQLRTLDNNSLYAMKVVDKQTLALKKKLHRAETERKILSMLDHPFLPTLYADFEASNFSCVVMEFCSGGDLHSLKHKQKGKRFTLSSARFYAAEVLLALEYLHMLGIVYRDLKPENVLIRSDGHIMLSDFDLSLKCKSDLSVQSPEAPPGNDTFPVPGSFSCFQRWFHRKVSTRRVRSWQFVAEPVGARSCSFVGTHEYVSPEVAAGKSHGNAVDWWAFGVFLYELIYGHTPFSGENNEVTLKNILKKPLNFPPEILHFPGTPSENSARSLISGLLVKDPARRLGSKRGAADIKTHPFFKGLNFALIRSYPPPVIPGFRRTKTCFERKAAKFDFF